MSYAITINGNNYALTSTSQDVNLTLSRTGGQGAKGDSITNASIDSNGDFHVIISNSAGQQVQDVNLGGANLIASITALKVATETAADAVDDVFLGSKSSAPSLDNDGNALQNGAMYFDTTLSALGVYNVNTWEYPIALATTSATNAANSATSAATSATSAATSATAANTSKIAAETAETNAETAETNAATSETNASASASTATAKAANAATSETNAATSETNAGNSATLAASSASSAATSESNSNASATAAATSETNAANSASSAGSSATAAANSATTAGNHSSNAAANAVSAASSASSASSSAANALNYKNDTATDRAAVELLFDNFDDKFLGTKTSDPTLDNDGNALVEGAMYYNSTSNSIKFYNGTTWESPEAAASNSATAAATSATNAASSAASSLTSANNAATSETNAATSETNASNSASTATTQATNAATSETNANNSASAAATSATNAATSATSVATSATNAANSATAAATSETNAATSATNAATSASGASTSATNAATSATAAQTAQAAAELAFDNFDDKFLGTKSSDPSVDNDGNALVEGAMYYNSTDNVIKFYSGSAWQAPSVTATNAATSATTSATSAATSATNAANSAIGASTSETNASNSATAANTSRVAAETAKTAAETAKTNAEIAETNAETAETNAATSATAAASSATGAASSATAAQTAQTAAEAALDSFDDRYLGVKASDPTVDNDGNTLVTGALYFNSGGGALKVYNGSSWDPTAATTEAIQDVVGSLITGTTGVSATYNDSGNSLTIAGTAATTSAAGTMSAADKTKIDGIEASADVTDTTNVTAAGALMTTGGSVTGNVSFGDNDKAIFGAGSDLQIYHDTTASRIVDAGTGSLKIQAENFAVNNVGDTENMITATPNGAVSLFYDGSPKLATTSTGVDITGVLSSDGLTVGGSGTAQITSTAAATLELIRSGSAGQISSLIMKDGGNAQNRINSSGGALEFEYGASNLNALKIANNGDISFYEDTGTTAKLFWDASAETLDIGSYQGSTINAPLNLKSDANHHGLSIEENSGTETWQLGVDVDGDLNFHNSGNATPSVTFNDSGNVGIGNSTLTEKLAVNGSINSTNQSANFNTGPYRVMMDIISSTKVARIGTIQGTNTPSGDQGTVTFYVNNSEKMRIDASGNLLVSKTSSDGGVAGFEARSTGETFATSSGATLYAKRTTGDGDIIVIQGSSGTVGNIGTNSNGNFQLYGAAASHVGLQFGSPSILPINNSGASSDNAVDLGDSNVRFKDLYLSGSVKLNDADFTTASSSTSSTSQTTIATFPTSYEAAKYIITAKSGSNITVSEMLIAHDGTTAGATEYGTVNTSSTLATYDVDINSGNVRLLATAASATSTTYSVVQTLINA